MSSAKLQPLPTDGGSVPFGGSHLFGSNPLIDNPLNPVYDAEQLGHSASYTAKQASDLAKKASKLVNTGSNVASGLGNIATFLTSTENWLRIGEVIAGLILLAMGLRTLAGRDTTPVSVATGAAKTAVKAVA